MSIIRYLLSQGADFRAMNKHQINMLHVAAQGDQPVALNFFKNKGLDINSRDAKMSTPLHWACFSGSEQCVYFLISWNVNTNI